MDIRGSFANPIYILPAVMIVPSTHEFAHTFVSYKLGDISQKQHGRLTLSLLRHLNPFGTPSPVSFGFGWAKPIQVDPYFYRNKKNGMIWAAMVGPLMNFIIGFLMVILYMLFIRFGLLYRNEFTYYLFWVIGTAASINIGPGIFNPIPVPPLDGSEILMGILEEETCSKLMQCEMYLSSIMIFLLMSGVLNDPLIHVREAILDMFVKAASMTTGPG